MAHCLGSSTELVFYHSPAKARPHPQGNGLAADPNIWCSLHMDGCWGAEPGSARKAPLSHFHHFLRVRPQPCPPHLPVDSQMRGSCSPKGTEPICKDLSFLFTRKRKDGRRGINSDVTGLRRTVGLEAIWSRCWQGLWERERRAAALSGGGVLGSGKDSNLSWNFWPTKDA